MQFFSSEIGVLVSVSKSFNLLRIIQSQDRLRLFLGVRFLGLRASGFPTALFKKLASN